MTAQSTRVPESVAIESGSVDWLRRSIHIDLGAWTLISIAVLLTAGSLSTLLAVPVAWLTGIAAVFLIFCLGWFLIQPRFETISPKIVRGIAWFNIEAAIVFWAIGLFGWFGLNTAARWSLAGVGDLTLILGLIQLYALRKSRSA